MVDTEKNLILVFFVIGIVIGFCACYVLIDMDKDTDVKIAADYVEDMVYGTGQPQHSFVKAIIGRDSMTVGDVKGMYKAYGPVSRGVLENQIEVVCNRKNVSS